MSGQDHGIKFCDNRALSSKSNTAIAFALLDIFTMLGAPAVLQTDNGREFSNVAAGAGSNKKAKKRISQHFLSDQVK
jgi:hypothetical protein